MVIDLLRELGLFTIGAGFVALIARYAIRQYFEKELRGFQSQLNREGIVFSDLHTSRAEVIIEFYSKLTEFDEDMKSLVDPVLSRGELSREEKIKQAGESGEELRKYYRKHKIYFPSEICDTMDNLLSQYQDTFHEFSIKQIHDPEASLYDEGERTTKWLEDWESLTENEVPEMRTELEEHFRELLGVRKGESSQQIAESGDE
jgi:polyhydroxyalkanoate synthesis regulator phasin